MYTRPDPRLIEPDNHDLVDPTQFIPPSLRDPVYHTVLREPVVTKWQYWETKTSPQFMITPRDVSELFTHAKPLSSNRPEDRGCWVVNTETAYHLLQSKVRLLCRIADGALFFLSAEKVERDLAKGNSSFVMAKDGKIFPVTLDELLEIEQYESTRFDTLEDFTWFLFPSLKSHLLILNVNKNMFSFLEVQEVMDKSTAEQCKYAEYFPHPFLQEIIARHFPLQPDKRYAQPVTQGAESMQDTLSLQANMASMPLLPFQVAVEQILCTPIFARQIQVTPILSEQEDILRATPTPASAANSDQENSENNAAAASAVKGLKRFHLHSNRGENMRDNNVTAAGRCAKSIGSKTLSPNKKLMTVAEPKVTFGTRLFSM
jgi:hypothetical protein